MPPERVIRFRPRTIFTVLAVVIAVAIAIEIVSIARQVLTWILISLFFALALNPAVEFFRRRGVRSRLLAISLTYLLLISTLVVLGATFIPTIVDQLNEFVRALPTYVNDLTEGRGRLGELADRYNVVERLRGSVNERGAGSLLGGAGAALAVTKGVLTVVLATVTIAFMTFFMLLEGPEWVERGYRLLPEGSQERWRKVGHGIYRTIGGYVTGNLTISLIAGITSAIFLSIVGVPYAVALGLVVALLDLIPLAGATLAAIIVTAIAFTETTTIGVIVLVYFVIYQQIENHLLQPLVYGRTVQLSPLAVLIAVLIGAELAGVLGALGAIPIAGTIQVILADWLRHRRERQLEPPLPAPAETAP